MLTVQIDMEGERYLILEVVQDGIGGEEVCWLEEVGRMTLKVERFAGWSLDGKSE
jgi:hypothetical protein